MMRGRFPEKMRIDLSVEDKRKLAELATDRGIPMAGWLRMAIRDGFSDLRARREADAINDRAAARAAERSGGDHG